MAVRRASRPSLALALLIAPAGLAGQTAILGTVTAAETGGPVVGARVTARRGQLVVSTDRMGRFRVWLATFPDTLVVTFVGRMADTVTLNEAPRAPLIIALATSPIRLSAITVTADGRSGDVGALGTWQLSLEQARGLPAAVESDVFRALALSPAVSFSSPLSARPMVRGFDAGATSVRIDGHEVFNLYHLGRVFSAFPADAAQQVSITAAPARVIEGRALSGVVDIVGQSGSSRDFGGGVDLSLASLAVWAGSGGRGARWFGAARAVHFGLVSALVGQASPYDVQDFYGSLVLGAPERPRGRLTVFASRDDLATSDDSMSWNNMLLGSRWQVLDRAGIGITHTMAITRFAEDAPGVNADNAILAVRNRLARIGSGLEGTVLWAGTRLTVGGDLGWRYLSNVVVPVLALGAVQARAVETRQVEAAAFAEWTQTLGAATAQLGVRLDATGAAHAVQPRARLQIPLGAAASFSAGAGRTAQLHHTVSDPRAEPDLTFYDFWLSAGDSGVPVSIADHATLELDLRRGVWSARFSAFAARGRGMVEFRPASDPPVANGGQFRTGRGRTRGTELQVAVGGTERRGRSLSVAYVLSASERNWGAGWVPWIDDQRHRVRVLGQVELSRRWAMFGAFEGRSGVPLTPVDQVSPEGTLIFGREHAIRSAGTAWFDFGARYQFGGPWDSRGALGLSVLNVAFGPVAPLALPFGTESFRAGERRAIRIAWERTYLLPPIPTVTLRLEF